VRSKDPRVRAQIEPPRRKCTIPALEACINLKAWKTRGRERGGDSRVERRGTSFERGRASESSRGGGEKLLKGNTLLNKKEVRGEGRKSL